VLPLLIAVVCWQCSFSVQAQSNQKNSQSAPLIKPEVVGLNEGLLKLQKEAEEAKRITAIKLAEEEARTKRIEESKAEMRNAVGLVKPNPAAGGSAQIQDQSSTQAQVQAQLVNSNPEQRLALVIGNSNYKTSPLANPAHDARAMAIKLQQLGFNVIKKKMPIVKR